MGTVLGNILIGIFGGFALGFIGSYIAYLFWREERETLSRKGKLIVAILSGIAIAFAFSLYEVKDDLISIALVAPLIHVIAVPFVKGLNGEK